MVLRFSVYTSVEISFLKETKFVWLVFPQKPWNWFPTNNSTFTVQYIIQFTVESKKAHCVPILKTFLFIATITFREILTTLTHVVNIRKDTACYVMLHYYWDFLHVFFIVCLTCTIFFFRFLSGIMQTKLLHQTIYKKHFSFNFWKILLQLE